MQKYHMSKWEDLVKMVEKKEKKGHRQMNRQYLKKDDVGTSVEYLIHYVKTKVYLHRRSTRYTTWRLKSTDTVGWTDGTSSTSLGWLLETKQWSQKCQMNRRSIGGLRELDECLTGESLWGSSGALRRDLMTGKQYSCVSALTTWTRGD
jgi:hypothetical protein